MRMRTLLAVTTAAVALSACGTRTASYLIDGSNDVALTVELNKDFFWADWDLQVIIRNNPECQRRHNLKQTVDDTPKIDVYSPEPGVMILRQGKRWYVTEIKSCRFQAFKEAPPQPGNLIGSFKDVDGAYQFVKAPSQ